MYHGYFTSLLEADVKDLGFGAVFFLQHPDPLSHDDLRDRVIGVLDIADQARTEGACVHAGGLHSLRDPVIAEVALLGCVIYRVEEPNTVGTAHDTVAAADTPRPVHQHHAVLGLVGCAHGAHLHAGRVVALVAKLGHEECLIDVFIFDVLELALAKVDFRVRKTVPRTLGCVGVDLAVLRHHIALDPGPRHVRVVGYLVFLLAGLDAEAAAHALIGVHQEYPADLCRVLRLFGHELFGVDDLESREGQRDARDPSGGCFQEIPSRYHFRPPIGLCGLWQFEHSTSGLCLSGSMPRI